MNRSLLNQPQQMRSYPSVTILMNSTRGSVLAGKELTNARKAIADVDRRPPLPTRRNAWGLTLGVEHVGSDPGR